MVWENEEVHRFFRSDICNAITVNNAYTLTLSNPFNSPVNSTPPAQAWSNYFEGTSASVGGGLTFPSSSNFAMGTGDFTVEAEYASNALAFLQEKLGW